MRKRFNITYSKITFCKPNDVILEQGRVSLQIPHQRPPSGTKERPRPAFGKKQYENARNVPHSGASKAAVGSGYSQSYGTISASGLTALQGKKWWMSSDVTLSLLRPCRSTEDERVIVKIRTSGRPVPSWWVFLEVVQVTSTPVWILRTIVPLCDRIFMLFFRGRSTPEVQKLLRADRVASRSAYMYRWTWYSPSLLAEARRCNC